MNTTYQELIKYRNLYKRLDQVTWSVRSSEKRFLLGDPENERNLLAIYKSMVIDFEDILNDLKQLDPDLKNGNENQKRSG